MPQLNPPSSFTQLSHIEPSKLCSLPRSPEKLPARITQHQKMSNPSQSEGDTRQLLQEVPQYLPELAQLQLEPLASAIPTVARLKEHCATVSPLDSKVVLTAYKGPP